MNMTIIMNILQLLKIRHQNVIVTDKRTICPNQRQQIA